ncbi:LigB subunit of an aromatic-ring-opening dioxygenase LigAB [Acaromyces ingoldii]|uniref:LigB subunit of an aromatic-ring-opening dioxygenase LigAB n=1 Tax=Acaromyces ingoldii TaxID=215250 RepID=A0A316YHD2_9BASI|nr:LigB subunit of an aromatic-ring-opening dioxygenase LigAB [Acaromyces ingoldii]PWN88837.1 LigB subunit of an aromatic-ring-opening dioxygenase LigAB [Acaromyces ingoldii]
MPSSDADAAVEFPAFFFSHGSTMMLGEPSAPAAYWEQVGRLAIEQGVERIVMMGAHWHVEGDHFEVATNPKPSKQPVAWVDPKKYINFDPNYDVDFAQHVLRELEDAGIDARPCPKFEIIHDTFLILKWMFPRGKSLPLVIISSNVHFDPHQHLQIGVALRHLRRQRCLLIGSGGAVHNLYRNSFSQAVFHRDNFAQERQPEQWALDFGQAFSDAVQYNSGPGLRRAVTRLMMHPQFRDAHATDDHFMPAIFAAGAAGAPEDEGKPNFPGAECWELLNMRNTQYQLGYWPYEPRVTEVPEHKKIGIAPPPA